MVTKLARLYLVNDILQNTTSKQSNLMSLKRGCVTAHTFTHAHAHVILEIHLLRNTQLLLNT